MLQPSTNRLRVFLGTFLFFVALPRATAQVNSRAIECPSDPTVTGYTSIADINADQFDELSKITAGSSVASPPYSFVLCPNTNFDASSQTLNIVLSGTVISCGNDMAASSSLGCSIQGGASQVYLADSTTPNYNLAMVTIIGVTFEMFNGTSIDVMATETLTLTLMDVVWKNFFSDFVIRQQQAIEGTFPARVDLVGGLVDNGMGGSLFSNDAGVLVLDQLTVANITSAGLVSTSNGGVVMMQSSKVSRSVIDTIASAMMGSTLSIMDVDVFDLVFTKTVFSASDPGTMLLLNRTNIRDINNEGAWKGIAVSDQADAKLEEVQFSANGRFESLVYGRNSATIGMTDCVFDRNFGLGAVAVSSVLYALKGSSATMTRTKLTENSQVAALALASMQSMLTIRQSCFMGGSADDVVFRSSDSMTSVSSNYVAMNVNSKTCPGGNLRLSVEQAGSQCYQEGSTGCMSTCDILGEESFCVADMVMLAPGDGTNGTMAMPGTANETAADAAMGTTTPVGSAPESNGTTTATMPPPGNGTADLTMGEDAPTGNVTTSPPGDDNVTSPGDGMGTTRIDVAFEIVNDMMITDPAEVNASGLGAAFPVYVEELVASLTTTARRQLLLQQRRRLEISLVPDSAWIYEIIPVECAPDNSTALNMTNNVTTTCHEAMGKYELLLSADEDPIAVRTTYARETRAGIDDGTFQQVLLEVDPNSALVVGPSIEPTLPDTDAPMSSDSSDDMPTPSQPAGPPTLLPSATKPKCPPGTRSKSKSKSKSRTKGAKGKGGRAGASKASSHKGRKMMRKFRRAHGGGTGHRNLDGHGQVDSHMADEHGNITPEFGGEHHHPVHIDEDGMETTNFANTPKEHDEGDYYMFEEEDYLNGFLEEIGDEECEPDYYYEEASSRSKGQGKGGYYDTERTQSYGDEEQHRRQLLEGSGLPRIHGAHSSSHRISDIRAVLAAELEEQG